MALAKRAPLVQDGLNKKHDLPQHNSVWTSASRTRPWHNFRRRRVLLSLIALLLIYLFIKYLPTDVPPVSQRIDARTGQNLGRPWPALGRPESHLRLKDDSSAASAGKLPDQYYDGPLKFYNLAASLRAHIGHKSQDSVLIPVYDLDSIATFIPFACDLAIHNQSTVHIALMGREDTTLDAILAVTGITQLDCPVYWHDARPDYNVQSSETRRVNGIQSGLAYLQSALQPNVVVIDDAQTHNTLFFQALDEKANHLGIPLTVLPTTAQSSAGWLSSLQSSSLAMIDKIQIDIVIHAHSNSAGALLRLLRSLSAADYFGLSLPRITIELPAEVDPFVTIFLDAFQWPPNVGPQDSKLSVHHRMQSSHIPPAEAALRTVESFYAAQPSVSHVLVLSPDTELSPSFYHVLMFLLLEFRYGQKGSPTTDLLMGISLHLPTKTLMGDNFLSSKISASDAAFLHQSPNSNAALYFGNKWNEFHAYLSTRLQFDPALEKSVNSHIPSIPLDYPAWMNQALELMQARGYYMIYPSYGGEGESQVVTMHKELHKSPEEYAEMEASKRTKSSLPSISLGESDVLSIENVKTHADMHESTGRPISLQAVLFPGLKDTHKARLSSVSLLPLFASTGEKTNWQDSQAAAASYSELFSRTIGGCSTVNGHDPAKSGNIDSLFCDPG